MKLTSKYRDIFLEERNIILINYAKQTNNIGNTYFIYSKSNQAEGMYNAVNCEEGKEHEIIKVNSQELPQNAQEHSILKIKNGKYVLDENGTDIIIQKTEELFNKLFIEQKDEMKKHRINGHIYKVSEKLEDRVCLYDITNDNEELEEIEELEITSELLNQIEAGDKLIYKDEKYQKI